MRNAIIALTIAGVASALSAHSPIRREQSGLGLLDAGINLAAEFTPLSSGLYERQQSDDNFTQQCAAENYVICPTNSSQCAPAGRVCCPATQTSCPAGQFCMQNGTNSGCCPRASFENCFLGNGLPVSLNGAVSKSLNLHYDSDVFGTWYDEDWQCDGSSRALFTNQTGTMTVMFDRTIAGFVIYAGADQGAEYRLNITNQIDKVVFQHPNDGCSPGYKFTFNSKSFNWLILTWLIPSNQYVQPQLQNPAVEFGRITVYANAADIDKVQLGDPNAQTGSFSAPSAATAVGGMGATGSGGASAVITGPTVPGGGASPTPSPSHKPSAADSRVSSHSAAAVCAVILAGLWLSA